MRRRSVRLRRLRRLLALGLLAAAGLLVGAQPAAAQTEPLRQRVNIYLIDVSEFDVGTGHFVCPER